jgi:hypothetical protein
MARETYARLMNQRFAWVPTSYLADWARLSKRQLYYALPELSLKLVGRHGRMWFRMADVLRFFGGGKHVGREYVDVIVCCG